MILMKKNNSISHQKKPLKRESITLLLLAIPFIVAIFLFRYLPIFGWIYSVFDYKPGIPLSRTPFIGFERFALLFKEFDSIARVLTNTLTLSFLHLLCFPLPVILAIMITEAKGTKFKKLVQTVSTLPHFISWVIIFSLSIFMFSTDGFVNQFMMNLGLSNEPKNVMANPDAVWAFQTGLSIWKSVGWNSIIYLAAIAGIDTELYDAAEVDGAGRFNKILHITVPGIASTFLVLLLLNISYLLNAGSSMEQYLVFYNGIVADKIEVLDLYVYRQGLIVGDYSYATAVGILKTFVSIILLFTANLISKKIRGHNFV
jgi:ABC-type polysaccharide transport system permease subunit